MTPGVRSGILPVVFDTTRDTGAPSVLLFEELLAPPVLQWVLEYTLAQDRP